MSEAAPPPDDMSPEQRAEAKTYGRQRLQVELIDKSLDVAFLVVMAVALARPLDRWLATMAGNDWLRLGLLFLITIGLNELVSLPTAFYAGYVLEHRHGLSRQTFTRWLWQRLKRYALGTVFGLLLVLGLYALIWHVGDWWWLAAAGGFFGVSVLLGQLVPVLIVPLFYKVDAVEDPELNRRMARLAEGTGLSIEGVYRLGLSADTSKANAMLAGLGRTRRVLMGDTLLERFTPDEIEVVFAHEVGHHVFRHIHKQIAAGLLYSSLGFWLCDVWLWAWVQGQGTPRPNAMPVYTLPMLMLALTLFSLAMEPLQNALSRRFERQCDRYALQRTGLREAYGTAFRKLARLNKSDPEPHWLEVLLFHSHPPISERLRLLE